MDVTNWKEIKIGELFTIKNGIKYPSYDRESGCLPLVSTSDSNNGISDYIADRPEKYSNILTVAYSGSVGATFYQENEVFVGETVFALIPKFEMDKYIGLFLCAIIRKHNEVYTYGRKIIGSRYVNDLIKIPYKEGKPDWDYMRRAISSIVSEKNDATILDSEQTKNKSIPLTIDNENWKDFLLKDIVKIDYGNKFDLQAMTFDEPSVNFVSRTGMNNGISSKVDLVSGVAPYKAGCLSIALGGSIGSTFYQPKDFYTGQNVAVIQFEESVPKYARLFLATIIQFEVKDRFIAFGRELNRHIKKDFIVRLPKTSDGKPDWAFMNSYIEKLPFSDKFSL